MGGVVGVPAAVEHAMETGVRGWDPRNSKASSLFVPEPVLPGCREGV